VGSEESADLAVQRVGDDPSDRIADAGALNFEPEYSAAPGFRCGFLGLPHLDIV
jgi:translation elongation factor EF-4